MVILACMLVFTLALGGCGKQDSKETPANSKADQSKEPIKIGAIFDISGPGSSLGIPARDSAKLWEKQINDQGGILGRPVEVKIYDNESDETKSLLYFKKLVEEDKVVAVAGASQSGTSIAMIPSANQAKIPLVSAAASIQIITPVADRQWVFKTAQNDSVVAGKIVTYLKSKNFKKIAFLSMNNAYGDSGQKEFGAVAEKAGLKIVANEKFGATDVDFTPQLSKVKKSGADVMVIWAIPPSASLVTKQAADLGIKTPIVHSHGIANKTFIDLAGPAANGVVFAAGKLLVAESLPDSDPQKKVLLTYIKDYEKPGAPRSAFGGHGYDALALIGKAIENAGSTDSAKIRAELEKMEQPGISGTFKMTAQDHSGISQDSLVMIEIKGGKWVLMK